MGDATVILNPNSGDEEHTSFAEDIVARLGEGFDSVRVLTSAGPDDITAQAREAREAGAAAVFAVGGDGTVGLTVRGLLDGAAEDEEVPVLGILPGGTGNGFARTLGIPPTIAEALERLDLERTRRIDIVFANGTPFIYTLTAGSLPEGIREVPSQDKSRLGFLAYVGSELKRIGDAERHPLRIRVDGVERTERINSFVAFSGNALANLFTTGPDIEVDDGQIHVLMLKDAALPSLLSLAPDMVRASVENNDNILLLHGSEIDISADAGPLRCGMDGDDGPWLPVTLTIQPRRIATFAVRPA